MLNLAWSFIGLIPQLFGIGFLSVVAPAFGQEVGGELRQLAHHVAHAPLRGAYAQLVTMALNHQFYVSVFKSQLGRNAEGLGIVKIEVVGDENFK